MISLIEYFRKMYGQAVLLLRSMIFFEEKGQIDNNKLNARKTDVLKVTHQNVQGLNNKIEVIGDVFGV